MHRGSFSQLFHIVLLYFSLSTFYHFSLFLSTYYFFRKRKSRHLLFFRKRKGKQKKANIWDIELFYSLVNIPKKAASRGDSQRNSDSSDNCKGRCAGSNCIASVGVLCEGCGGNCNYTRYCLEKTCYGIIGVSCAEGKRCAVEGN